MKEKPENPIKKSRENLKLIIKYERAFPQVFNLLSCCYPICNSDSGGIGFCEISDYSHNHNLGSIIFILLFNCVSHKKTDKKVKRQTKMMTYKTRH